MEILTYGLLALAAVLILAILVHLLAAARFRAEGRRLVARLAGPPPPGPIRLPDPLKRYARAAGGGKTAPRLIRLTQEGEFRADPRDEWMPMPATQHVAVTAPGFVWEAVQPGFLVPKVRVIDAFVAGEGVLKARALGSIPVADEKGDAVTRSEAMRYLAELPWAPDAILSNPAIRWSAAGAGAVEARLPLVPDPAVVQLKFDAGGDIVEIEARRRPARDRGGKLVERDWIGKFSDYQSIGGRRIPTRGEVGYVYDFGYAPYWRGRITGYELLD